MRADTLIRHLQDQIELHGGDLRVVAEDGEQVSGIVWDRDKDEIRIHTVSNKNLTHA